MVSVRRIVNWVKSRAGVKTEPIPRELDAETIWGVSEVRALEAIEQDLVGKADYLDDMLTELDELLINYYHEIHIENIEEELENELTEEGFEFELNELRSQMIGPKED